MKRYNNSLFLFLIILPGLLLTVASCQKALDKSPLDRFDQRKFWTSETNAFLALTGVYRGNIFFNSAEFSPTDWWSYNGLLFLEFASDNAYDRRGDNSPVNKLSNGTLTPSVGILGNYWSNSYARIARCNDFLENIGKVQMDEDRRKRFIAEVRFIRACQYFYLSQYFGSVPLVTKTLTPDEANTVTKAPEEEVEKFVDDELNAAEADLPRYKDMPASEFGRASKQAAMAFLGRLYLAEERWQDAASVYKQIVDWGDNAIDPNYASLFDGSNETSTEIIFSTQYVQNLAGNGMLQHFWPAVAGGWHISCPLGSLVEAYEFTDGTPFSYNDPRYDPHNIAEDRDPRLGYTVMMNGDQFKGRNYITHPDSSFSPDQLGAGKQTTQTGYGLRKFATENFSGNLQNSGIDVPVIRYAEVLLGYLEASIRAGVAVNQGLLDQTINQVRQRASVNMPRITETDPARLLPVVLHERRIELACEGIRYWDLLRLKIADSVLNGDFYGAPFPGAAKLRKKDGQADPYSRWYVTSKHFRKDVDYHWPVPLSEVNINPNLK